MPLLQRCKVLVVEDEFFLAEDLAFALRSRGAGVVGPIADFDRAVDQASRSGFDVAVLDINLGNKATYVIADQLKQSAIPFMFTTGYSAEVIPDRFRNVIRLEKPYQVEQLVEMVSQLCNAADA